MNKKIEKLVSLGMSEEDATLFIKEIADAFYEEGIQCSWYDEVLGYMSDKFEDVWISILRRQHNGIN